MSAFENKLPDASAEWVAEGLITQDQRAALLARHPPRESGGHRFVAILSMIGATLLAVGLSLLVAAHWARIGDWVKIIALLGLVAVAHGAGWRFKISPGRNPKTGDACFMVASVLFLLGIALVSQIFHLDRRPSDGVLLWWLGIALLPWLVRARGMQGVSLAAGLIWLGLMFEENDSWLRLVAGGPHWAGSELQAAAFFMIGAALFFAGTALRSGTRADFAGLHEQGGLFVAGAALYALSLHWSRYVAASSDDVRARWIPFALLALLLAAALVWAARRGGPDARRWLWWFAPGLVAAGGFVLGGNAPAAFWLWGAVACLALFWLSLGMIRLGLAAGRESWINLGLAFIALNVLTRYFDLFGTMMEGGVFFVVTGAIVLSLGLYLEKKRRSLLAALRRERR